MTLFKNIFQMSVLATALLGANAIASEFDIPGDLKAPQALVVIEGPDASQKVIPVQEAPKEFKTQEDLRNFMLLTEKNGEAVSTADGFSTSEFDRLNGKEAWYYWYYPTYGYYTYSYYNYFYYPSYSWYWRGYWYRYYY